MLNERKLTKTELAKREDIIMNMKKNKRSLVKKYGKDAEAVMYGRATNQAKKQSESMKNPKLTELIKDALKNPKKADLNKDGKLSDYEEKRGAAIEKNLKEENIGLADIKEIGYEAGEEAFEKIKGKFNNKPDHKAYKEGFFQGYTDNLGAYGLKEEEEEGMEGRGEIKSWEELGYGAGEKAAYTYGTLLGKLKNRLDKLAYSKGFMQGVKDELGSSLSEDLSEDLDLGHQDNEPGMLKAELYHIGSYAMELYKIMDDLEGMGEIDLPSWWQSKITTAKNMISSAKHYLEFELKEPAVDAMVDRLSISEDQEDLDADINVNQSGTLGDAAIDRESASGAFEENLDIEAKVDALQRLKRGEIDTLPSEEDAEAALVKRVLDKLAKQKMEEGLPKGFFDKAMDAKDEDQDGKIDESKKLTNKNNIIKKSSSKNSYAIVDNSGKELKSRLTLDDAKEILKDLNSDTLDESYATLVNKLEKQGKGKKAAKAIAGAVASYKAKGGGKGPTAKQK